MGKILDIRVSDAIFVAVLGVFCLNLFRDIVQAPDFVRINKILYGANPCLRLPARFDHRIALQVIETEMGDLLLPAVLDDFGWAWLELNRGKKKLVVSVFRNGEVDV